MIPIQQKPIQILDEERKNSQNIFDFSDAGQKNSLNQINQFHEKIFDQIPFFGISKMAKNQFLTGKKFKTTKNAISRKNLFI